MRLARVFGRHAAAASLGLPIHPVAGAVERGPRRQLVDRAGRGRSHFDSYEHRPKRAGGALDLGVA